jgi:hypothetical protein
MFFSVVSNIYLKRFIMTKTVKTVKKPTSLKQPTKTVMPNAVVILI